MQELFSGVERLGLAAVLILGAVWFAGRLAIDIIPKMTQAWQAWKLDQQEHKQNLEVEEFKAKWLDKLTIDGAQRFQEEQLTLLTAETQTQLAQAHEYIQKEVSSKLDIMIERTINLAVTMRQIEQTLEEIQEIKKRIYLLTRVVAEHENKKNTQHMD